nr:EOG090X05NI [Triops cancriformis]
MTEKAKKLAFTLCAKSLLKCLDVVTRSSSTSYRRRTISWARYLRWISLPFGLGVILVALQQFRRIRSHPCDNPDLVFKDWEVYVYRSFPLRMLSRMWGWLTSLELPIWARKPVLGLYARMFGCNLEEAELEDLAEYRNLSEFFRRQLKEGVRPLDPSNCIISPSDGKVLHFGKVDNGLVEQVKGVTYSLSKFLGPATWNPAGNVSESAIVAPEDYQRQLLTRSDTDLYHCVIYLAPGDYHRFHSPVEWNVNFRRHFPGELLSVNPGVAKWVAGLFSLNERAIYVGQWKYGFFSMAPVGATNVGSIKVYKDQDLRTNCRSRRGLNYYDYNFREKEGEDLVIKRGELFGEFNLGSTIVLIFEAPKNFDFTIKNGQVIRVGQALNQCFDSLCANATSST